MVEKLLAAGANPNAAQTSGLTPLMMAAQTGNVQVVKALLAHGANVNAATTETQQTALMWAVAEGHLDIAQFWSRAVPTSHVSSRKGFTPLLFAARNGDIEMATVLLAAGAGVNETGSDGTQALPLAIVSGHDRFALFLLERGADPNGTMAGVGALHAAAGNVGALAETIGPACTARADRRPVLDPSADSDLVKALLARGADPNARITTSAVMLDYLASTEARRVRAIRGRHGRRARGDAVVGGGVLANGGGLFGELTAPSRREQRRDSCSVLLAAGADHRLATDDGTTPLMVAAGIGPSHVSAAETARRPLAECGSGGQDPRRGRRRRERGQ